MERILSNEDCEFVLNSIKDNEWERVDRYGKYDQTFIDIPHIENKIKKFFGKELTSKPILKVLRFSKGDLIPTYSADYSNMTDEYYKRYINTNFIIQLYLNDDFKGGNITHLKNVYNPSVGCGIIQNKTDKCSISKIEENTCYMLFMFITNIKQTTLL